MIFIANRIAGAHTLESDRGANVARQNLADLFALVGVHFQQTSNTLSPAPACVKNRVSGLELPGVHTNKCQLADKRIGHDLEGQRRKWLLVISLAKNLLTGLGIQAMSFRHIERRREIIHYFIQQRLYAFILERRPPDDREDLQSNRNSPQRPDVL